MSKQTNVSYFQENKNVLIPYGIYWGIDEHMDKCLDAADANDTQGLQYAARHAYLALPDTNPAVKMGGYYMLLKIGGWNG